MNSKKTKIRKLHTADYAQWLPLWHEYLNLAAQTLPDAATDITWQRITAEPPVIHGIGAFADERLLAFAHYHEQWNSWRIGSVIYIEDLLVAREARRQGIARQLIEHIIALARKQGSERVFWKTHAGNHGARALYRQLASETDFVEYEKIISP
ncbi:MAG: GNAT family N-acetyltransferase [Cardiobacteriaceae bacterium]|nr:GNAT family N-acetyltransferase [Cardiobacteriaceae bacterium]